MILTGSNRAEGIRYEPLHRAGAAYLGGAARFQRWHNRRDFFNE